MSLLLDALKKSGAAESTLNSLSEMQLEDARIAPAHQTSHQGGIPPTAAPDKTSTTRTAAGNLFSVKKTSIEKRRRLGIISITVIAGGILAAGGGYLYFENQRASSPPEILVATPPLVATPRPVVATMPTPLPLASLPEIISPATASKQSSIATLHAKKIAPHSGKIANANTKTLNIRHQQEPDSIDAILASAYQSYQHGDYATAWLRYRAAFSQDPKNRDALLGLGVIAQQQGQGDTALHYYRQVLVLDPRDPVAHAGLSTLSGGDSAIKESRLKQLIAQQADSAALHFALGHHYVEQSRWSDARQAYFNALAMEPSNALYIFSLATSLDHLGQHQAAASYYQQALQLDTLGHSGFSRAEAQQRLNNLISPNP